MQFMIVVTFLADVRGTNLMAIFVDPHAFLHAPTDQLKVGAAGKATRMAPWSVRNAKDSIGQAPQRHGNHGLGWRGTGERVEVVVVSWSRKLQHAHDHQAEASERLRMAPYH